MAKYTIELREICEGYAYANDPASTNIPIEEVIDMSCDYIFDFDFPIWNEEYRHTLEKMRPSSNAPNPVVSREAPATSSFPGLSEPP